MNTVPSDKRLLSSVAGRDAGTTMQPVGPASVRSSEA